MAGIFTTLQRRKDSCLEALTSRFARWTKPLRTSLPLYTLTDLGRSKSELLAENALLRQQLIVLRRQVKRPTFTRADRILLVLLARLVRSWQQAHITRATRYLAAVASGALPPVLEAKIKDFFPQAESSRGNHRLDQADGDAESTLGAERIRGELLKLGLRVCKRTIQKYMRAVRTHQPRGQTWATFLRNHAAQV
jgi:putative transposase